MTIQRRPRPQLRRQLAALAAVGGVLYHDRDRKSVV